MKHAHYTDTSQAHITCRKMQHPHRKSHSERLYYQSGRNRRKL